MLSRSLIEWGLAVGLTSEAAWILFRQHAGRLVSESFEAENAFYYSFYLQVIQSENWYSAYRSLYADRVSEAPHVINALRRFNIYQELLIGSFWRVCRQVNIVRNFVDAASFYCCIVLVVYGCGLVALFGNLPRKIWCVLIASAMYHGNLEHVSNVTYMPPLRENVGIPFWFASCVSIQVLHQRLYGPGGSVLGDRRTIAVARAMLVLSCVGLLLAWQFACFALLLQALAVGATVIFGAAPWCFVAELGRLYSLSAMLSSLLRFGDLWALRSMFFYLASSVAFAGFLVSLTRARLKAEAVAIIAVPICMVCASSALQHLDRGQGNESDDAHIFEFLLFRFGLWRQKLTYHAALYEGQRSFSSPTWQDWYGLLKTCLLPASTLSASAIFTAAFSVQRGPSRYAFFTHVFLLFVAGATSVLFCLMMRFRVLFVPHLVLLGSLLFDESVLAAAWSRSSRIFKTPFYVAVLGVLISCGTWHFPPRNEGVPPMGNAEREEMFQWLRQNVGQDGIAISDMGVSASLRQHVGCAILCHPHYESAQLRENCYWADKLNGHRTLQEYHDIIKKKLLPGVDAKARRVFVVVSVQACFSVNEKGGSVSEVVELDEPHRIHRTKTCELLLLLAHAPRTARGFFPRFVNRWYQVHEVSNTFSTKSGPSELSMREQCAVIRLGLEELDWPAAKVQPFFEALTTYPKAKLDVGCLCAAARFWPPDEAHHAHTIALDMHADKTAGFLGCCLFSSKVVKCLDDSAQQMKRMHDLNSAERYQKHVVTLTPQAPKRLGHLGFMLLLQGRHLNALEAFRNTLKLENERHEPHDTTHNTTKCGEALALAGLGQVADAAKELENANLLNMKEPCVLNNPGLLTSIHSQRALEVVDGFDSNFYDKLCSSWEHYAGGVSGWRDFLTSSESDEYVKHEFVGRKLLFLGSARIHLPMVLLQLRVLRQVHQCSWPAEFWMEASEFIQIAPGQKEELAHLHAVPRILPSPYATWKLAFWEWRTNLTMRHGQAMGTDSKLQKYALKSLVLLLSDCRECLFLDADNFALQSPEEIMKKFSAATAVFWPDLWDIPNTETWRDLNIKELKSQESGQLLVRKSGTDAKRALLLASLFAVRIDIFLEAIYGLHDGSLMCGYGDKDTFHFAFRSLNVPILFGAALPAVALNADGFVGLVQVGPSSEALFLHYTWGKSKNSIIHLLQADLERCDFKSLSLASNLSCSASQSGGNADVPFKDMSCKPLIIPRRKKILRLLLG